MARFVYAIFANYGRLNPALGVVKQLVADGHEVTVFSNYDLTERLSLLGIDARAASPSFAPVYASAQVNRSGILAERFSDHRYLLTWYRIALLSRFSQIVDALDDCVRTERPDVLVADPIFFAAGIVGQRLNVPWACVSPTLLPVAPREHADNFTRAMDEIVEQVRQRSIELSGPLECARGQMISPWLNTVFTVEEFAPRCASGNTYSEYVGPMAAPATTHEASSFAWADIPENSELVYVTGGTQAGFTLPQFHAIARAFDGLGVIVVIALFDGYTPEAGASFPDYVRAVRFVPQAELMARVKLVACHGGANTVMEALMNGVPVLAIPRGHDQGVQAALLETSGAGRCLSAEELTEERAREIVSELLDGAAPERMRAEAIARACRADGAAQAARLLGELAATKTPYVRGGTP